MVYCATSGWAVGLTVPSGVGAGLGAPQPSDASVRKKRTARGAESPQLRLHLLLLSTGKTLRWRSFLEELSFCQERFVDRDVRKKIWPSGTDRSVCGAKSAGSAINDPENTSLATLKVCPSAFSGAAGWRSHQAIRAPSQLFVATKTEHIVLAPSPGDVGVMNCC